MPETWQEQVLAPPVPRGSAVLIDRRPIAEANLTQIHIGGIAAPQPAYYTW
jgi:hypothetical protein